MGHGLRQPPLPAQRGAQAAVGFGVVGPQLEGLLQMGNGLRQTPLFAQRDTEIAMGLGVARRQAQDAEVSAGIANH